jgi:tRNA pseudouridine32 synthase/23S rRNA pseudouridine746 synthase
MTCLSPAEPNPTAPPALCWVDETALVIDKPCGLPAVPGRTEHLKDCAASRVQSAWPDARVVHRLDMATSGLMLLGRGAQWQREYSRLFAQREVHKHYVAVVSGLVADDHGEIDLPLIADWPNRPKQRVDAVAGKPSLTRYCVIDRDTANGTTRVELQPVTGRSHQLRVHLLSIGHAIVGDALYADEKVASASSRLLLHAQTLEFLHPASGVPVSVRSDVPF